MVQNKAQADLEIIGRFKTGSSGRDYPAAAPISVRIGNVEAGSGTARYLAQAVILLRLAVKIIRLGFNSPQPGRWTAVACA